MLVRLTTFQFYNVKKVITLIFPRLSMCSMILSPDAGSEPSWVIKRVNNQYFIVSLAIVF